MIFFGQPDKIVNSGVRVAGMKQPPQKTELEKLKIKSLIQVKWAINAKPDIMIISDSSVLLIDAKVESGEGRDEESGYQQYEIQELISYLLKLLIPQFSKSNFLNKVLKLMPQKTDLSWQEVLSLIQPSEINEFSMKCLSWLKG